MLLKMKNKSCGIFIYEDPKEFLKVICELQEHYNSSSDEDGVDINEY